MNRMGLLSSDSCREMIDSTSDQGRQLWESYHQAYASWAAVKKQLEEFQEKKQEHERRLDILQWEIQQISDAAVHAGEDDEIWNDWKTRKRFMKSWERPLIFLQKKKESMIDWLRR